MTLIEKRRSTFKRDIKFFDYIVEQRMKYNTTIPIKFNNL